MSKYDEMASAIQSTLSITAWEIQKETAFREFYKEHGRFKEARASKEYLKGLHIQQIQNKRVLKVLQEYAYIDQLTLEM